MMRIGVASVQVPFIHGGAERHSENLCTALRAHGHEATEIRIPYKWYPPRTLVDHVLATRLIDVSESNGVPIDLLIGLKFPAYLLRHPNKVLWVLHQHRQAYDLWDSGLSELLSDPEGPAIREFIQAEDKAAFKACEGRLYANSGNVAGRIHKHLGLYAEPLYHPPAYAELLRADKFSNFIFVPSRLCEAKRQKLLIEALAQTRSQIEMVIAGPPDMPGYDLKLQDYAKALGIERRITWLGAVDDAVMAEYYSKARAVAFVPIDEDYGYVTLEAMISHRPVITTTDSGGPLEFIRDRKEGLVVSPTAAALGNAFDELSEDLTLAERMGSSGYQRYNSMDINWTHVVAVLTGHRAEPVLAAEQRAERTATEPSEISREIEIARQPDLDFDEIRKRFAIPPPGALKPAITQFDQLYAAYDFSKHGSLDDLKGYFGTHWQRYLTTMSFLPRSEGLRILDIGIFAPFIFQALVSASCPGVEIAGIWEGETTSLNVKSLAPAYNDFDVELRYANVDTDILPFEDSTFDVVLGLEILEHLAINPLLFFQESARVLKPGGLFIVSTPNIASHRGVTKILRQEAPYSFGIFVPTGGVYGRHNREYTPHEVENLGLAVGFETRQLITADVYDNYMDMNTIRLLAAREDAFEMRGETIFYSARRGAQIKTNVPQNLYHGNPNQMAGRISIEQYDPATGMGVFAVSNASKEPWCASGSERVTLYAEWYDVDGRPVHALQMTLDAPVLPGLIGRIPFSFGAMTSHFDTPVKVGEARVELFIDGVGRIRHAGRANLVRLACTEQGFLRLKDQYEQIR